jgi:hypothetical protein
MAIKRTSRKTARQRRSPAHSQPAHSLYRRRLRCEPLEDRRLLATVTVTTALDTVDFNDGLTSLREAIFATNLVAGEDTIDFAPALTAGGLATILLTQGELAITDSLTIIGPGANLLTIDASGSDPTPDQNNGDGSRVFNINDGSFNSLIDVFVTGLSIAGGDVLGNGGGIFATENLSLSASIVRDNAATRGGGIATRPSSNATLVIQDTQFVGNTVTNRGGGLDIDVLNGSAILDRITVSNNQCVLDGGGAFVSARNSNFQLIDSSFSDNSAGRSAGGMWASSFGGGSVLVNSSTFHENQSTQGGGGAWLSFGANTPLLVEQSTFSTNSGGGLRLRMVRRALL